MSFLDAQFHQLGTIIHFFPIRFQYAIVPVLLSQVEQIYFTKNCSHFIPLNSYFYSPSDYLYFAVAYKPLNQSPISLSTTAMLNTLLFLTNSEYNAAGFYSISIHFDLYCQNLIFSQLSQN